MFREPRYASHHGTVVQLGKAKHFADLNGFSNPVRLSRLTLVSTSGGGGTTSERKRKLSHLYMNPSAHEALDAAAARREAVTLYTARFMANQFWFVGPVHCLYAIQFADGTVLDHRNSIAEDGAMRRMQLILSSVAGVVLTPALGLGLWVLLVQLKSWLLTPAQIDPPSAWDGAA